MAAVSRVQSQRQPPIGLKEGTPYDDYSTCRIYHEWIDIEANNNRIKRSADTLYSPDASNKELLLRCFHEYVANCADDLLGLNNATRHVRAREILGGHLKTRWTQVVATAQAAQPSRVGNDDFAANVRAFMRNYLPANAFLLQDSYLRTATKPFAMDCYTLADRIDLINELSIYLPGGNGTKLFGNEDNETERKNAYYRLMPPSWQLNFDATGNDLANDAYTINNLVSFMEQQRLLQDYKRQSHRRRRSRTSRGNRGNRDRPYPRPPGRGYDQQPRAQFQHQQYSPQRGHGRNCLSEYSDCDGQFQHQQYSPYLSEYSDCDGQFQHQHYSPQGGDGRSCLSEYSDCDGQFQHQHYSPQGGDGWSCLSEYSDCDGQFQHEQHSPQGGDGWSCPSEYSDCDDDW